MRLDLAFLVSGTGRPSLASLDLAFRIRNVQPAATLGFGLDFAVNPIDPTIYVFDRGDWQPSAQRAWAAGGWFPGV